MPNLGAGTFQLRLGGPAATTAVMQVTLTGNAPLSFNLPLVMGGSAKGSVLSPSGLAVPDAQLVASSEAFGVSKSIDLDASGRFSVQGLRPGTYMFTASAPGREEISQQVTMATPQLNLVCNLIPLQF